MSIRVACPRRTSFNVSINVFPVLSLKNLLNDTSAIPAIFAASPNVIFSLKLSLIYFIMFSILRLLYDGASVVKDMSESVLIFLDIDRSWRTDMSSSTESNPCFCCNWINLGIMPKVVAWENKNPLGRSVDLLNAEWWLILGIRCIWKLRGSLKNEKGLYYQSITLLLLYLLPLLDLNQRPSD